MRQSVSTNVGTNFADKRRSYFKVLLQRTSCDPGTLSQNIFIALISIAVRQEETDNCIYTQQSAKVETNASSRAHSQQGVTYKWTNW
jgi:hypothetical protein